MLSFWAALKVLADVFGGMKELAAIIRQLAAFIKANREEAWFKASAETFNKIRAAQTDEERKHLAQDLNDLYRGLSGVRLWASAQNDVHSQR
jgi:hypothetical protein